MRKLFTNKKALTFILVLSMVFAMTAVSFADTGDVTVTIKYQAYDQDTEVVTPLATQDVITVDSGTSVKDAVDQALSGRTSSSALWISAGTDYYLEALTLDGTTYTNNGTSTPSVPGDWTHGTYEGTSWMYMVDGNYPDVYMSGYDLDEDATVTLSFETMVYEW